MHALMTSAFVRRELQLSFYANETTSTIQGIPCKEGERSIDFYSQCFKIPRRLRPQLSRSTTKRTQWYVRPANYTSSLGIYNSVHRSLVTH